MLQIFKLTATKAPHGPPIMVRDGRAYERFVVIISILGVVLFATPGCKPKGSNESAGGSADSADAVPESPIPLGAGPNTNVPASNSMPAPALGAFSALGLFHFEENSLSDNAINQIDSYPISPKLATVVPASHGTGVLVIRARYK